MVDGNENIKAREVADEDLEQISGGAMVVNKNRDCGKDGDRP